MLAFRGIRRQHIVVKEQTVQHHACNTDAAIDDDPKRQHRKAGPARDDPATGFKPEHKRIEDEGRRDDDTGLETAPRPLISVEQDIESEDDDRREKDLRGDPQYRIVTHRRHPPFRPSWTRFWQHAPYAWRRQAGQEHQARR